jgi:hypothetical protein
MFDVRFEIHPYLKLNIEHRTSPSSAWVRIASSVQGFFHGPLPNPGSPEAMRTQALFIVNAPQKTVQCGSVCVPSPGKRPIQPI